MSGLKPIKIKGAWNTEITGKYNTAKVFIDSIEDKAIEQIKTLCDVDFFKNSKIRVMPDCHSGVGCTIGTTMTIQDKVAPNLVGVDIGCGVLVAKINKKSLDLEKLDKVCILLKILPISNKKGVKLDLFLNGLNSFYTV